MSVYTYYEIHHGYSGPGGKELRRVELRVNYDDGSRAQILTMSSDDDGEIDIYSANVLEIRAPFNILCEFFRSATEMARLAFDRKNTP